MDKVVVCLPAIETYGKSIRPALNREIRQGEILLLKRFPRGPKVDVKENRLGHVAPPILGVFDGSNRGSRIEQLYFVNGLIFKVDKVKFGESDIPVIERYTTGQIIKGSPEVMVIPGRIVSEIYAGIDEITEQLREMKLSSVADLVSRIEVPYLV